MSQTAYHTYLNYLISAVPDFRHRLNSSGQIVSTLPCEETFELTASQIARVQALPTGLIVLDPYGERFLFTSQAQDHALHASRADSWAELQDAREAFAVLLVKRGLTPERAWLHTQALHGALFHLYGEIESLSAQGAAPFVDDLAHHLQLESERPHRLLSGQATLERIKRAALNPRRTYRFVVLRQNEESVVTDWCSEIELACQFLLKEVQRAFDAGDLTPPTLRPAHVNDLPLRCAHGEYTRSGDALLLTCEFSRVGYAIAFEEVV